VDSPTVQFFSLVFVFFVVADWNITFWTSTDIFAVTIASDDFGIGGVAVDKLFNGTSSSNVTNAVAVDNVVFFTDWNSK